MQKCTFSPSIGKSSPKKYLVFSNSQRLFKEAENLKSKRFFLQNEQKKTMFSPSINKYKPKYTLDHRKQLSNTPSAHKSSLKKIPKFGVSASKTDRIHKSVSKPELSKLSYTDRNKDDMGWGYDSNQKKQEKSKKRINGSNLSGIDDSFNTTPRNIAESNYRPNIYKSPIVMRKSKSELKMIQDEGNRV
jgi:hypothetical protein